MTHVVVIKMVRALFKALQHMWLLVYLVYKVFPGTSLLIVQKWALLAGSPF